MTASYIIRASANTMNPVQGNVAGVPFSYPVGVQFSPTDSILAAIRNAGITPEQVYTAGTADGTITISGTGTRIPVNVNGDLVWFALNTPFTPTAAQRAILDNAGIAYTINYANAALAILTLSAATLAEDAAVGTEVGTVVGSKSGSTLVLTSNANDFFVLSGNSIVSNKALDFETTPSHNITIKETNDAYTGSPKSTTLAIAVTDVEFGPELVTNGNFTAATGWTLAGAKPGTIAAGKLTSDVTGVGTCTRAITVPAGDYTLVYTIDTITTGTVDVTVGNAVATQRSTAATFTESLTVASGTTIVITCTDTDAVIDNVSVKLNI